MAAFNRRMGLSGVIRLAGVALPLCGVIAPGAFAELAATATISTAQGSAPFDYTITLHNTGDTNISAFWFAWTETPAEYDFLPTEPANISGPTGWVFPVTHNGFPGDGYGIEWYNYLGSAILPGGTGLFHFTSNDSPTDLAGDAFFPGFKVTNSVVYIGFPQFDPGYSFVVTVPAPGAAAPLAMLGFASLVRRRRGRAAT